MWVRVPPPALAASTTARIPVLLPGKAELPEAGVLPSQGSADSSSTAAHMTGSSPLEQESTGMALSNVVCGNERAYERLHVILDEMEATMGDLRPVDTFAAMLASVDPDITTCLPDLPVRIDIAKAMREARV